MQTAIHWARSSSRYGLPLAVAIVTIVATATFAYEGADPVVARAPMRFAVGDEVIDQIDKGDLLTVVEEREQAFVVLTFRGKRGLVSKADVALLADAVEIYSELIAERPDDSRLLTLRASAWWARGDQQQALADYDKAIELGLETSDAYTSRALFHASLGNHEQAMADYTKAIELDPAKPSLYTNRAAVHMSRQAYQLAMADYDSAIELRPTDAHYYQQRAIAWKIQGRIENALADYTKAIELKADYVDAWISRGFMYYRIGEYDKAIADLTQAIELAPGSALTYNNRGYNRQLSGDSRGALADYEQAIRLEPEYPLAHLNKAWILAACHDDAIRNGKQAIEAATTACRLTDYENTAALKALAAAFAEDGQFDKAVGWQERVSQLVEEEHKAAEQQILAEYHEGKAFRLPKAASAE